MLIYSVTGPLKLNKTMVFLPANSNPGCAAESSDLSIVLTARRLKRKIRAVKRTSSEEDHNDKKPALADQTAWRKCGKPGKRA